MEKELIFVASRKQLHRMAIIVSKLKRGNCTMPDIQDELERSSRNGLRLYCSERTVRKDMDILRKEYNCPVEYDQSLHKYVLQDKEWEFCVPALMNTNELLALIIGEKISKDILPPSISNKINEAVNEVLRFNRSDGTISSGRIDSLKLLSNTASIVSDKVFQPVFNAWKDCKKLYIDYNDRENINTTRIIEPHALVFYEMQWSIRAKCPEENNNIRTFQVGRINCAYVIDEGFIPDKTLINSVKPDNYYMYEEKGEVKIRLTQRGAQFAKIHILRSDQVLTMMNKDTLLLTVKSISEEEALKWLFSQLPGDAIPIAPQWIVNAFKKRLETMLQFCNGLKLLKDPPTEEYEQCTSFSDEKPAQR